MLSFPRPILAIALSLVAFFARELRAGPANDDLFPPDPEAAKFINFDGQGFLINGKRTFIASGSVHYSRVPRENWRDILLKLKRSGFNTVESYVFWNYHEAAEGQFDFTTESRDFGAFLDTAKDLGLYAIVRVGPYNCAEWENGGFPTWLLFKPGMEVRKNNAPYLACVDAWFNKMLPIVSARQIQNGGNVILVQLENEHPTDGWRHWGTDMDGAYFRHLLDLAHRNGLKVPMFFSGLNHSKDPAPHKPIDSSRRKSPWMSTELWTTWFDRYGNSGRDLTDGERHPWRVLAEGGNGFNLYMYHGGTNFDYFNFNDDMKFGDHQDKGMASYDYGTLLGQTGETRDLYLRLKRLALFAESFPPILAHSNDATQQYKDFAQGAGVTARTAPEGTLVFLDNGGKETRATLKSGLSLKLAGGETAAFAVNVPVAPGLAIAEADTRILGIVPQGGITTLVCFGETGDAGKVTFSTATPGAGANPTLSFTFPAQGTGEELLDLGAAKLRVLAMSKETADKTWFIDTPAGRQIVIGAPYLGEFAMDASGKVRASVDYPWNEPAPKDLTIYGGGPARRIDLPASPAAAVPLTLRLAAWEMSAAGPPDRSWFTLPDGSPPEIGEDGDVSPYAWYSTRLSNSPAISSLKFKRIGDRATFFVDGRQAAAFDFKKDRTPDIPVDIPAGTHDLAVFVAHAGRTKYFAHTGTLNFPEAQKGLRGPVTSGSNATIAGWKMRGGIVPKPNWSAPAAANGAPAFYRTTFRLDQAPEPGVVYRLATEGLSFGNAWLNGHNLGCYPEILKGCPGLWLPSCWMKAGGNTLEIFDEKGNSPEKTSVRLEEAASRHRISFGPD